MTSARKAAARASPFFPSWEDVFCKCWHFRKSLSTSTNDVISHFSTLLFVKYGSLIRDDAMFKVNLFGFALNIAYLCLFYVYTPADNKTKVWAQIGLGGIFGIGLVAYTEYEDPKLVEFRFGLILTAILVVLVGSPLLDLGEIIRTKSTACLPLPIILAGTLVSLSWFLYGLSIQNSLIAVRVQIVLSSLQPPRFFLFFVLGTKLFPLGPWSISTVPVRCLPLEFTESS